VARELKAYFALLAPLWRVLLFPSFFSFAALSLSLSLTLSFLRRGSNASKVARRAQGAVVSGACKMDISTEGDVSWKTCILVSEDDEVGGLGQLAECHTRPCRLHRAFSLFLFDKEGRQLLQQRSKTKYSFPLVFSLGVCSHPRKLDKTLEEWVPIRLEDELGIQVPDLIERLHTFGKLTYSAVSDPKYGEMEVDWLFYAVLTDEEIAAINFEADEVESIRFVTDNELSAMLADDREFVSPWFRAIVENVGAPFFDRIKKIAADGWQKGDTKACLESPEDGNENKQVFCNSTHGAVQMLTWEHPTSKKTLPWFRVGNLSVPHPKVTPDHLLQTPFSYLSCLTGNGIHHELVDAYAQVDTKLTAKDKEAVASIVGRIHNASVLHADIAKDAPSRQGAVCAHKLWGMPKTLNAGTFNFLKAIQGADVELKHQSESVRATAMRVVLEATMELHRGRNACIAWPELRVVPSTSEFLDMVDLNVGALFVLCASLGATCSGSSDFSTEAASLLTFARFYQAREDLCEVCDPAHWSAEGFFAGDILEKVSFPLVKYFEATPASDSHEWLKRRLQENEPKPLNKEEKLKLYDLLFESKALEATRQYCCEQLKVLQASALGKTPTGAKLLEALYLVDVPTPERAAEAASTQ